MAGEEQLVFHDFLGITCRRGESENHLECKVLDAPQRLKREQVQEVEREEETVKSVSTSTGCFDDLSPSIELLSWPQGSGGALQAIPKPESIMWQGKRRDNIAGGGEFLLQQLGMDADVPETPPHLKVSRFERLDDRGIGHVEAGLHMAMSTRWDNSRHLALNSSILGPTQAGLIHLHSDNLAVSNIREISAMVPGPPADEGSRTGMKGPSVGILLNTPSANVVPGATHTNPSSGRSKSWPQGAGSKSMYVASQQTTTPTSRQLTIFYGGQAHVFDDVPSDKADAIMTLARSSGRSWSTMYTPRPKASVPGLGSEMPQSMVDGEKSSISKATAMDCVGQSASEVPHATSHSAATSSQNHKGALATRHGGVENNCQF